MVLLVNKTATDFDKMLLKVEVDVAAVIKYDDSDERLFHHNTDNNENMSPRCNYEVTVNNTYLLEHSRAQYFDWHIFPVARSEGRHLNTLTEILTNQLLVYNFLNPIGSGNEATVYSPNGSSSLHHENITQYSFGVRRASGMRAHNHRPSKDQWRLPNLVYLDKTTVTNFTVKVYIASAGPQLNDRDLKVLDNIHLSLELSAQGLVTLTTSRSQDFYVDIAVFTVTLKVNDTALPVQGYPGMDLHPLTLSMRATSDIHCAIPQSYSAGYALESVQSMDIFLGCPPQLAPKFDLQGSINQLEEQFTHLNCLNRVEHANCFYFQHAFYPQFMIYDMAMGTSKPFHGKYTLRVIGGGTNYNRIKRFSPDYIKKSNTFNQTNFDYLAITPERFHPKETHNGYPVYDITNNAIVWHCNPKSDCAYPPPAETGIPEYYFLLKFSNSQVDLTTNCKFELEFVVRVFGYKIGQQDYAVLLGTLLVLTAHIIGYYFWKTRFYWLAKLHRKDNQAINRLLSIGNLDAMASQASLKNQLLEAIYTDDTHMLTEVLAKTEDSKGMKKRKISPIKPLTQGAKRKMAADLKELLEKQIAEHDIRAIGLTVAELTRLGIPAEDGEYSNESMIKAKKILAKKAHVVLHLIDAMEAGDYKELSGALVHYKEFMPFETLENNSLVRQATAELTSILTKQLLKSLKKKDTWEIHFAIREFRNHNIYDKFHLVPKAEQVIYNRLTTKLKKAIRQGTPQLLRDAITDTERDLSFHHIADKEGMLHEAKNLLYKILKDKLAEELKKRDTLKIRNAINRFAYYGVSDASGFLDKANKNLYNLVIPPIAKSLEQAKAPEEIYQLLNKLKSELNRFGLQDKENIGAKAEKMLYDTIAKQLQAAIKSKAKPKTLAVILAAFVMSKKQYKIQDLRKLEESGKSLLYQQLVPFLVKAMDSPEPDIKQLSAAIIAARIEFSRIGLVDSTDIIEAAESKMYNQVFAGLKEAISYGKESKALWIKMKSTQTIVREYTINDRENLLTKAELRIGELIKQEVDDAVQKKDLLALKDLKEFSQLITHPSKMELVHLVDKHLVELENKLSKMNTHLQENLQEYHKLCDELRVATAELENSGKIQNIMPIITKFETSGFPDNDNLQKLALAAVASVVDTQFKKHIADENYGKIALLRDVVNSTAMEAKTKDMYYLLTVLCGKYLTIKGEVETSVVNKSSEVRKHIYILEQAIQSLATLKISLPPSYETGLGKLEKRIKDLIEKAGELNAFLESIEEIKTDLYELNPADILTFERYIVVTSRVFDVLRAFLIILGKGSADIQTWVEVRKLIGSYSNVVDLLKEAEQYSSEKMTMSEVLEARDLCEHYMELINVTEESSSEHMTLAIILKWVLLIINQTTTYYKDQGVDMQEIIKDYAARRKVRYSKAFQPDVPKDTMVHGKVINPTEVAQTKALISACSSLIKADWTAAYLARWIKAYPLAQSAILHLNNSVKLKNSLKLWRLHSRYSARDPLFKYGGVIECSGMDSHNQPVFLCQFSRIDFEGLTKSCTQSQFMLHMFYLLEMVEHQCRQGGYNSMLIVDCLNLHLPTKSPGFEGLSWFQVMMTLMCRNYPGLFKIIYVIHGSRIRQFSERLQYSLFTPQAGIYTEFLEGDGWKEILASQVDEQCLPPSLGGTYNFHNEQNSPARIPYTYYMPKDVERKSRAHWTALDVENAPRIVVHKQVNKIAGALLFVEFEPDGYIDFEIYHLPPGVSDLMKKTVLLLLAQVDHYYSHQFDASKPGTYHVAFSNNYSRSKRTVGYESGLANNVEEMRDYVYKLETDKDGNLAYTSGSNVSFLIP